MVTVSNRKTIVLKANKCPRNILGHLLIQGRINRAETWLREVGNLEDYSFNELSNPLLSG